MCRKLRSRTHAYGGEALRSIEVMLYLPKMSIFKKHGYFGKCIISLIALSAIYTCFVVRVWTLDVFNMHRAKRYSGLNNRSEYFTPIHSLSSRYEPWSIGNDIDTIVAYVQSSAVNTYRRCLIRKTWGDRHLRYGNYRIQPMFVIGSHDIHRKYLESVQDLYRENAEYGDILYVPDVIDTYDNLTLKEIRGKRWISDHVTAARHVLKVDDDAFINTPLWVKEAQPIDSNFYHSECKRKACFVCKVWRHPKFCSGSGYLMTKRALDLLVKGIDKVPFYKRDDRYFTGMVARKMGVTHIDKSKRYYFLDQPTADHKKLPLSADFLMAHNLTLNKWEYTWHDVRHRFDVRHRI